MGVISVLAALNHPVVASLLRKMEIRRGSIES